MNQNCTIDEEGEEVEEASVDEQNGSKPRKEYAVRCEVCGTLINVKLFIKFSLSDISSPEHQVGVQDEEGVVTFYEVLPSEC